MTLAGFVAPIRLWSQYELAAAEVYQRYGVTLLHARDLHATDGEFKNWRRIKKQSFCVELSSHMRRIMPFGISISVEKSAYLQRKKEYETWDTSSAFGIAFMRVLLSTYIHVFYEMHGVMETPSSSLSIILEDGNKNNNEALILFNEFKHNRNLTKLASLSFAGKSDTLAIQFADLLAFYSRRWMDQCVRSEKMVQKPVILTLISNRLQVRSEGITDFIKFEDLNDALPGPDWERVVYPPR